MTESTGGHWLDTGDGLQSIEAFSGYALEDAANTAYRAYLDHRPGCTQCRRFASAAACTTAAELWQTYIDTRVT